jgi:hypothetical protein
LLEKVEEAAALGWDIIVLVVHHPGIEFREVVVVIFPVDLDGLFGIEAGQ